MSRRDPSTVDDALVSLVRDLSARAGRPSDESEVRAALAPLSPREEKALRRSASGEPPARPLGPFAWADIARGTSPAIAAARELGGYYALQAERDALAARVGPGVTPSPAPVRPRPAAAEPEPEVEEAPEAPPRPARKADRTRVDQLLGLFTYHRDAPSVAKSLGVSLAALEEELDALGIRRKAFRLTKGTDFDLPIARATPGVAGGPPVRRRVKGEGRPQAAAKAEPDARERDAGELKKLLAVVGPRRAALAERLGPKGSPLGDAALIARFRAAGLERELGLRERDFILGLYMKYRGSERRIAGELGTTPAKLRQILRERGLGREVDRMVDGFRRELRNRKWPKDRILQVLDRREYLADLGVYEELEREVIARTRILWEELREKPRALDELRRALDLTRPDLDRLRKLAQLG